MADMQRAWSRMEVKSFNESTRSFSGIASTPTPDRMEDIVEPMGAQYNLPIPLLWMHDSTQPVGHITSVKTGKGGITVTGTIVKVDEPPSLKEDLDRAWAMIKAKLVQGLSIGFNPLEHAPIPGSRGNRYTKWAWLELSCVTIPANMEASIINIKAMDNQQLAAIGNKAATVVRSVISTPPGDSGKSNLQSTRGKNVNIKEQISAFEAKRAASVAAMEEIMTESTKEGATLTTEQKTAYDEHKAEVVEIDEHLVRLKDHEKLLLTKAQVVTPDTGRNDDGKKTVKAGEGVIRTNVNIPKGISFVRYGVALAQSKGNLQQAHKMAKQWKDSTPEVESVLAMAADLNTTVGLYEPQIEQRLFKTAVAAGNTTDSAWAAPLVQYTNMASEFVELLRPQTIIGRLQGLRRVPFNIRFASTTSGTTMAWVGQALGKPVSKMQLATNTLGFAKAAGIVVITKELAMLSSPAAETMVRDDMIAQMAQFLDQQFIDPGVAAVANVSPASITNGLSVSQASANPVTLASFEIDLKAAINVLLAGEIPFGSATWVMTPYSAMSIGMLRDAGGDLAYASINAAGGSLFGLPVVTSNSVPHSTSAGSIIVLVSTPEVFLADEGGIELDVSEQASLEMADNPSGAAASLFSLWQNNCIGLRAERMINWQRRRTAAVTYIDNVHFS